MFGSKTRRRLLATLCVTLGVAVVAPAAASATPKFFGLTADGELVKVKQERKSERNKKKVLRIKSSVPITGLPAGVSLKGIDQRPKTGDLYGVGTDSVAYRVNESSGIAIALGPAFCEPLEGPNNGLDFNPMADAIRIVAESDQNLRVFPDSRVPLSTPGACAGGIPDSDLDIAGVEETGVAHAAYTNSQLNPVQPMTTTLFVIDVGATDTLYIQNPPNDGTLTMPVTVSGVDVTPQGGFDILGSSGQGFVASDNPSGGTRISTLDTTTGAALSLGRIGDGSETLTGLAVDQATGP